MYKNPNLAPEERAKDLLSKMTLDEKFAQLHIHLKLNDVYDEFCKTGKFEVRGGTFSTPKSQDTINKLQEYAINNTRLGIPILFAYEAVHGFIHPKATAFPQCAAIGGSFDLEAFGEMADIIGMEVRASGIRQVYAPNVDISREPRWGRVHENFGEDPYLAGEMGAVYVKNVQKHNVAATAKHFVAYGVPEGGINLAPAHIGEREIREVMLEPFQKCIDAGVMSVMPSYGEIDGEPVHGSVKYLKDILRKEMGFDGAIVSDYSAIDMMHYFHNVGEEKVDVGRLALKAGVDIEAPDIYGYNDDLKAEIESGKFDIKYLDEAVYNVLLLKFRLGLFEDPYTIPEDYDKLYSKKAQELCLKLDEESILLLENDGILPLDEKKVGKVALIGNNVKESFTGGYTCKTDHRVDFYDGMVARLGEENVLYAKGTSSIHTTDKMIEKAVETAKQADTVFLVLGDCSTLGGGVAGDAAACRYDADDDEKVGKYVTCGEGYDVTDLKLMPAQKRLFDAVIAVGKPTVFIVYGGRPFAIKEEVDKANAFMFCFGAGDQNGHAMANLIFGDKSPSAKLSMSFPQSVGHLPCYYNYKTSARGRFYKVHGSFDKPGRDYVVSTPDPWYPFGYGLSYTKLNYSNLTAENLGDGKIKATVDVENVGDYDIFESVLLFVRTPKCPTTPFVKKLRKFKKVNIKKGEKVTVEFLLGDEDFTYVDNDYKTQVLRGRHFLQVNDLECEIFNN